MDMVTAVKTCLGKYADFQGRARRSEYWFFVLFEALVMLAAIIIGAVIGVSGGQDTMTVTMFAIAGLAGLALFLPSLAVDVRRFHDLGQTGWLVLVFAIVGAIPFVGVVTSLGNLIWFCMRGTVGANNYGTDPYDTAPSF
ncbi:MAG: DUF805 domain-containing protein [Rhizomicrobium sp.]|nr:DUF805 domain-containing protein [Rhizomicrobium sp.]